jgi:hypothetical protein
MVRLLALRIGGGALNERLPPLEKELGSSLRLEISLLNFGLKRTKGLTITEKKHTK